MVRVLIELRRTITRHQLERSGASPLIAVAVLALLSAAGTFVLGVLPYASARLATETLALVFALWLGGRITQSALSGEPLLRPELFGALPLPRAQLGRALLITGILDPANVVAALAFAALLARGARLDPVAFAVAVPGVVLTTLAGSVLATIAGGVLGPAARRGHDLGTVLTAVLISAVAVAGTLLPALLSALRHGRAQWLSAVVRVLPSGWAPVAVAAAARGSALETVLPLAGLTALLGLAVLCWPWVLGRRIVARGSAGRGGSVPAGRGSALRSPVLGVAAKELRLWLRDPIRCTCLLIAVVVGTGVCVLPWASSGSAIMLPFTGSLVAVIAGACACNLYANDGTSLWLTVVVPGSARPDVRGRQLAWLAVVVPYAAAVTVTLTLLGGRAGQLPEAMALLTAICGGAAGLVPFASLVAVAPLDGAGNPTPAWSLKVHIALVVVAATALPALALLIAGLPWAALVAGAATGVAAAHWLGARAVIRLRDRQVAVLRTLVSAAV